MSRRVTDLRSGWSSRLLVLLFSFAVPALVVAQGPPPEGLPAEDAALLLSGQTGGALPVQSAVLPVAPTGENEVETRITIEIPVASVLGDSEAAIGLRVAVYAIDGTGALVGSRVSTRFADPERLAASGASGVRWIDSMTLPAAPVSMRILIRLLGSERFGLRVLSLDLTSPERGWLTGTYPIASSDGWIEPAQPEAPSTVATSALPVARAGEPLRLLLVGPGADTLPSFELGPEDGSAPPVELPVTRVSSATATGGWRHEMIELTIPRGSSGRYALRQKGAASAAQVIVVGDEQAQATTWPELMFPGSAREQTAEAPAAPTTRGRVPRHAVTAALRRGLDALGSNGVDAGEKELSAAFETLWRQYGSDGMQSLIAGGMQLGGALAAVDAESLPPLITTTDRLYRRCLDQKRFGCSSAARRLTIGLLDLYSTRSGTSRPLAAAAWSGLGAQLLQAGLWQRANAVFQRALQLEPGDPAALLAVGELHERLGDYEGARKAYARLVRSQPDSAEARLRLGVQLIRLGQEDAGVEQLQRATRGSGSQWARIVAWEEWASAVLASSGEGPAEAVLEKALMAFPGNEQLTVEMAALLDRRGRGAEASHLTESLPEPTGERSARNIYGDWPLEALSASRQRFQHGAEERLPALRRALREAG